MPPSGLLIMTPTMPVQSKVDVVVCGAGPAGLSAALRLNQFGYRVAILERSKHWPRPQIGEALTPGLANSLDLLDASAVLAQVPMLSTTTGQICWRSREPEQLRQTENIMVERAAFDAALLQLAQQRGVQLLQPAQLLATTGRPGAWQLQYRQAQEVAMLQARFILDASGRTTPGPSHYACAPRLAAIWAEFAINSEEAAGLFADTRIEALAQGWCWGARLPDQHYRIMWLGDPHTARQHMPGQAENWLRSTCQSSVLFQACARRAFRAPVQVCVATPQLALDSWQAGRLKLGDAAFALDPISSSGVEKAMRFSLQCANVVHTLLKDDALAINSLSSTLCEEFYQQRLIETCATHMHWTQALYRQAWCRDLDFWQARCTAPAYSTELIQSYAPSQQRILLQLQQELAKLSQQAKPELKPLHEFNPTQNLRLSSATRWQQQACIIDQQIQAHTALTHPQLSRPVAYLENVALFPKLNLLQQAQPLSLILREFGQDVPASQAQKIINWLWQRGIIEQV